MPFMRFVTLTFMQYVTLSEAEGSPSTKQITPIFAQPGTGLGFSDISDELLQGGPLAVHEECGPEYLGCGPHGEDDRCDQKRQAHCQFPGGDALERKPHHGCYRGRQGEDGEHPRDNVVRALNDHGAEPQGHHCGGSHDAGPALGFSGVRADGADTGGEHCEE